MLRVVIALTALLTLVSATCGAAPSSGSGGAGDDRPDRPDAPDGSDGSDGSDGLDGRTFLSTSVTEDGVAVELVAGTSIRLRFQDGDVGFDAGCNRGGGRYALDGTVLVVEALAMTEMGCDPDRHEQDRWLAALLTSRPAVELDDGVLRLRSGGTVIELVDRVVADPDRPLAGTAWLLDTLVQGDAASTPPAGYQATLRLEPDGRFSVQGSCNQLMGSWRASSDRLEIDGVASTKMGCPPEVADVERLIIAVLEGRPAITIEAAHLRLSTEDGTGLGWSAG